MSEKTDATNIPEFSLVLIEKPVRIKGKDGVVKNYTIRQMDYSGREAFNMFQDSHIQRQQDGQMKIVDYRDLNTWIIARMLFDENNKQVPISVLRSWPDSTVDGLYDLCVSIQEQDGKGFEKAKNE